MNLDIMVCIPSTWIWPADFGICLAGLVGNFAGRIPPYTDQNLRILKKEGSILLNMREQMIRQARDAGCTHVLFIDSDQTFPPNTLRRLLQWQKPVVACNVAIKRFPSTPTARLKDPVNDKGRILYTDDKSRGLVEVWRVGTGIMLLDLSVFDGLPEPWFNMRWRPEANEFQGEDWCLCELLESRGVPIYVDQGLSWEIGHIGKLEYVHSMTQAPVELIRASK
jgi:hypothetical protein